MNKDFDLKKDSSYGYSKLRGRIDESIKGQYDDTGELDLPQAKLMPVIPVTGKNGQTHKYFNNKSPKAY